MLKERQIEIINDTFKEIHSKFPQTELGNISFDIDETWVKLYIPDELFGDDKLDDLIVDYVMDIREKYGFSIKFHAVPHKKVLA